MKILKYIFNQISLNNWDNVLNIIKSNKKKIDFNIPINNIYFIEFLIINNKLNILKKN